MAEAMNGEPIQDPRSTPRLANLTRYERIGMSRQFNLADGHAHQLQDQAQREITRRLPMIFADAERTRQVDLEADFQATFYRLAGQTAAIAHPHTLQCCAASQSIDVVAATLAERRLSVALLQPCFDNLAALLARRGVPLVPLSERDLHPSRLARTIGSLQADAVFLTLPNNPTGFMLQPRSFELLAERCAAAGKVLIIDWTFRFFDAQPPWDQYQVLQRTGVSYICIEDTGKTWPTLELKCSLLASSADLYRWLVTPHNDLLLNVSPFVLRLLVEYLVDTEQRGLDRVVRQTVRHNRKALHSAIAGSVLVPESPSSILSVAWLRVDSTELSGLDVVRVLDEEDIGILPGEHFYWHEPKLGAAYVRVALARDRVMFAGACRRLREAITRVSGPSRPTLPAAEAR
jgi:aspartate/methionine/tyrosine aminotransferase